MRIICPNCGAQYEVPDEVIPASGRDVQCSNCGETWFQPHPDHPAAAEAPLPPLDEDEDEDGPDWDEVAEEAPEDRADTGQRRPAPEDTPEDEAAAARRRGLDPEIARLLREEAEREARARAAEAAAAAGSRPDAGLSEPDPDGDRRARQARARMARLRGDDDAGDDDAEPAPAPPRLSRRDLLPDIEETTSSITAEAAPPQRDAFAEDVRADPGGARAPGGFRRGLRLAVVLAMAATLVYVLAPRIGEAVPALAPSLESYALWVDRLRVVVNGKVLDLVAQLRSITGG